MRTVERVNVGAAGWMAVSRLLLGPVVLDAQDWTSVAE